MSLLRHVVMHGLHAQPKRVLQTLQLGPALLLRQARTKVDTLSAGAGLRVCLVAGELCQLVQLQE